MVAFLKIFQIVVAILLIAAILVQTKGSGLGATFGGSDTIVTTKRGAEKVIHRATIVLAVLFVLTSISFLFVR